VFLETLRQLKRKVKLPIGAYISGPFTLAGLMIGANNLAIATIDTPEVVHATVNFSEHVITEYAKALQDAGADMICILDPTAVILSPTAFWEFAGKSVQNLVRHLDTRTILHICGNTEHLIKQMVRTGVHGLSLDSLVNLPKVAPMVPDDVVLIGNVSPVETLLQGDRERVRRNTLALMEQMRPHENFIVSTGCDLPQETPLENIEEFVKTAKAFRR
jgi:MtaA/CmuA family methyltransferase